MPLLFVIQAISGSYPDIAKNLEKSFFKIINCHIWAFFTLRANRSHYIGFVAAHSQYLNTASRAAALPLQQSRLVNNPGQGRRSKCKEEDKEEAAAKAAEAEEA
jgi:hypothetical protein